MAATILLKRSRPQIKVTLEQKTAVYDLELGFRCKAPGSRLRQPRCSAGLYRVPCPTMHIYIYIYMYVCMYVCIYIYIYMYTCTYYVLNCYHYYMYFSPTIQGTVEKGYFEGTIRILAA